MKAAFARLASAFGAPIASLTTFNFACLIISDALTLIVSFTVRKLAKKASIRIIIKASLTVFNVAYRIFVAFLSIVIVKVAFFTYFTDIWWQHTTYCAIFRMACTFFTALTYQVYNIVRLTLLTYAWSTWITTFTVGDITILWSICCAACNNHKNTNHEHK